MARRILQAVPVSAGRWVGSCAVESGVGVVGTRREGGARTAPGGPELHVDSGSLGDQVDVGPVSGPGRALRVRGSAGSPSLGDGKRHQVTRTMSVHLVELEASVRPPARCARRSPRPQVGRST